MICEENLNGIYFDSMKIMRLFIKDLWLGIGSAEEARIQRFNLSTYIILQDLATKDINVEKKERNIG